MKKIFEQEDQGFTSIETPKWERFIQPQSPEQPLIRIYRNEKESCFDALFAIELAGVDRERGHSIDNEENRNDGIFDCYRNLYNSVAANDQGLEFIYRGGRDDRGKAYFNWRIVGRSKGGSIDAAAAEVQGLWHNLNLITGSVNNAYTFIPVIEPERLKDEASEEWLGVFSPLGISINSHSARPMGFLQEATISAASSVLISPRYGLKEGKVFDPIAKGFSGCSSEVKVILSLKRFKLSCDELRTVTSALRWLRNGEGKGISYHPEVKEGSNNEELVNSLESALEQWSRTPQGLRVNCMVMSKKPIPSSFLQLTGSVIFRGAPFSVSMEKQRAAGSGNKSEALDLQGCINDAAAMPPVFPGVTTLLDCNVKRSFPRAILDMPADGILLGNVGCGSSSKEVRLSGNDRSRHCYVLGATGTGKSTLLYNMIKQDIDNGEGVTLIDPHGDLYEEVLSSIPEHRLSDVVLFDPCDFSHSPGINFLECNGPHKSVQMNFITNEMLKIFDKLYDMRHAGGPIFEQYMRNALLLIMDNDYENATIMDLPLLFEDLEYRQFLIEGCKNPHVKGFWQQAELVTGDAAMRNMAPYITSKFNQFTTNALIRPIIGQPSTIDLREIMDKGKILLINLSKGYLGEFDTQLLGMLIVGKLFSCAMSRVVLRPEDRRPMSLYIDEFQNFTTDSISYMLSEARKFGIRLVLANQNMSQLKGNNILESVLGNCGSMLFFRLGAMDAEKMGAYTKPALQVQDLQDLPDFHVAARLLNRNVPGKPFVFKTNPMITPVGCLQKEDVKKVSRIMYTRKTKDVEDYIHARRTEYKNGTKEAA